MSRARTRPRVSAEAHNRVARAAAERAGKLEGRLARILEPILARAGEEAATAFVSRATDHVAASLGIAVREPDPFLADLVAAMWKPITVLDQPTRATEFHLRAAASQPSVTSTSTMLCVKPRPDEAEQMALPGGLPADSLHVTLAYLGQVEGDLEPVSDALRRVAASHAPLAGVVGGAGFFAAGDDGNGPAILLPDVPGLVELRVAATEALQEAGIGYGREHGFEAHVTVATYGPDGIEEGEPNLGVPLHFDSLLVVRGDEVVAELPLTGVRPLTAAGDAAEIASGRALVDEAQANLRRALESGDEQAIADAKRVSKSAKALLRAAVGPSWSSPAGDELIDVDALAQTLRTKTDPVRQALVETTMTPALKQAGLAFDLSNPFAARVLEQSGSQIKGIAQTTQLNVMRIIRSAHEEGLTIPDTATAIRVGMRDSSASRAVLIARTELVGAVNGASLAATQIVSSETGDSYVKVWLTAPGAPFPRHEDYDGLDGQTTQMDAYFDVGGSQLQFPGDPDGDPAEVCNCRCALAYEEGQGDGAQGDAGTTDSAGPTGAPGGAAEGEAPPADELAVTGPPPGDTVSVAAGPFVSPDALATIDKLGLNRSLDELTPTTAVGREVYARGNSTEALFKQAGDWSAERKQLHDEIVSSHFKGKAAAEGKPTSYFTAGGGASGKSHALFDVGGKDVGLEELGARPDTVWIDPDKIKEMLPEYTALRDENDFFAASGVHEESSELAKRITAEAQERGLSVIVDTTGSSSGFVQKLEAAKAAGYDVQVTMFSTPTNEAIMRAIARADKKGGRSEGRYVALQALKKAHAGASRQLAIWKDSPLVKEWRVYDNSGTAPKLVAEGRVGAAPTVYDAEKFDAILAKANEQAGAASASAPATTVAEAPATTVAATPTVADFVPGAPGLEGDVRAGQAAGVDAFARKLGIAPEEWRARLDAAVAEAVSDAEVRVRVTPETLAKILDDGRFKSQFETRTSGGIMAPKVRAEAEREMFGYPETLPDELRPIYGYLAGSTDETGIVADIYGGVLVRLAESVRERTTFTLADSLGPVERHELMPVPLADPGAGSLAAQIEVYDASPLRRYEATGDLQSLSRPYGEAQIHGGLAVSDISEVVFDIDELEQVERVAETNVRRFEALAEVRPLDASEQARLDAARDGLDIYRDGAAALRQRLEDAGISALLLHSDQLADLGG